MCNATGRRLILANDVEKLEVVNLATDQIIAVVTEEEVTTANEHIVVKLSFKNN